MKCVVHGDDFTVLGPECDLRWFAREFAKHFEVKVRGRIGPGPKDDKEATVLNRVVRWTDQGIEYCTVLMLVLRGSEM